MFFGRKLFDRTGRGLRLTPEGQQVCELATRMQTELDDLRARLRTRGAQPRIVIAASTTVGNYLLSGLLREFEELHPSAEFVVHVLNRVQVVEEVCNRTADLGYVVAQSYPPEVRSETMAEVELIIAAAPGHPLLKRRRVPLALLGDARMVMATQGLPHRKAADAKLRELGIQQPHVVAEFGSAEAMKRAVEADLGIGMFSQYTVQRELAEGRLARVPVHHAALKHRIDLIYRADRTFEGLLDLFVAFLKSHQPAGRGQGQEVPRPNRLEPTT